MITTVTTRCPAFPKLSLTSRIRPLLRGRVLGLNGALLAGALLMLVGPVTARAAETPANILSQPKGGSALFGRNFTFDVLPGGDGPFSYQWFLDDAPLPGETNLLLRLTDLAPADAGGYSVAVSNAAGGVMSSSANLSVADPIIVTHPADVAAVVGEEVEFEAATDGTGPLLHQWFRDGAPLPGQTNLILRLPSVGGADRGAYTLGVSNLVSPGVFSSPAMLTVVDPIITTSPVSVGSAPRQTVLFQVAAAGTAPLRYQWFHDNVLLNNETNPFLSLETVSVTNNGAYTVRVNNEFGAATSAAAILQVGDPRLLTGPVGGSAIGGGSFTFEVEAEGTLPLSYQWSRDGVELGGATDSVLTLSNLSSSAAGGYSVLVTNLSGSVTSLVATLVVVDPLITRAPVGGTVASGSNFTFSVVAAGSAPLAYRWFHRGIEIPGQIGALLTLTNVTVAQAGNYSVEVGNSSGTVSSGPAELVVVELKITKQPQAAWAVVGENFTNSVEVLGMNPLSYQWHFRGQPLAGATNAVLRRTGVTTDDAGSYSVVVSNATGTVTSETVHLVVFDRVILSHPVGGTAVLGAGFGFSVTAGGTGPFLYQWLFNGVELAGETASTLMLTGLTAGQAGNYSVRVSNGTGSLLSRPAALEVIGLVFLEEPEDQEAVAGEGVTFGVMVDGAGPFSYQWRRDGTALAGETNILLELSNVTAALGGAYSVVVSNMTGSITSRDARLTVRDPIVLEPGVLGGYASVGEDFSFTVSAAGTQPLIYQWFFNGLALEGEVLETLHLMRLAESDAGSYSVQVRNAAGTVTSPAARLSVTTGTPRSVATGRYTSTGYSAELEILLEGNGNETGLSFSIAYNPMVVANPVFVPSRPATHVVYTDAAFPDLVSVELDLTSGTFLRTNQQTVGTLIFEIMYDGDILQSQFEFVEGFIPTEARGTGGRFLALATELKPSGVLIDPVPALDPLSGLFVQRLLLSNPTGADLTNVVVDVYGLGGDSLGSEIFLYNGVANDFTDPGRINRVDAITDSVQLLLPPGTLTAVTMEYYVSDRGTVPVPGYEFFFASLAVPGLPAGGTLVNIASARFIDGRFLIEFMTEAGRDYYVEYSDKFGGGAVFTTSFPPVRGTGGTVRWIDSGAPRTGDLVNNMRCYRVLRAP